MDRQNIYMRDEEYQWACSFLDIPFISDDSFADGLFVGLGAKILRYLDNSPYEGADLIHALNLPIPGSLEQKWSCVIDDGTLEHMLNFPEAIKNSMGLFKEGGHLLFITPCNGFAGHGFYQFSPEVFFRVLSDDNGFRVKRMLMHQGGKWFSIKDPQTLGYRVEIHDCRPTLLYVSARRLNLSPIFSQWPQQSDYSKAWSPGAPTHGESAHSKSPRRFLAANQNFFLEFVRALWRRQKSRRHQRTRQSLWAQRWPERHGAPI